MDRQACRKCAEARNGKKPIAGPLSQRAGPMPIGRAKLAPWAQMEAASKRATAYSAVLAAVQAVGGREELEQAWSERLKQEEKQATATSSAFERFDDTEGYVTRAEKRLLRSKEAGTAACNAVDEGEQELEAARRRAAALEEDARAELQARPATQADGLEDAIRTLMVALHSLPLQLPPQVRSAASAVAGLLPQHAPSADFLEEAAPVAEHTVAAGRMDEPLGAAVDADGDLELDLDLEPVADESIVAYAARVKTVVSKPRRSEGLGIHGSIGKSKAK